MPDLPTSCLEEAVRLIRENPQSVVTGPSGDGSFYLIGLTAQSGRVPRLFADVRWGTQNALDDVEAGVCAFEFAVHRVAEWHDVDTPDDLAALAERLRHDPTSATCTTDALRRAGVINDPKASSRLRP